MGTTKHCSIPYSKNDIFNLDLLVAYLNLRLSFQLTLIFLLLKLGLNLVLEGVRASLSLLLCLFAILLL
jgi:hypothetical protein